MKAIFTGSRDWTDRGPIEIAVMTVAALSPPYPPVVIHGGCRGADALVDEIARHLRCTVEVYEADWQGEGRAAGPRRNRRMVEAGADRVYAFPLPDSRGTYNCMQLARDAGIPVYRWEGMDLGFVRWPKEGV